MKILPYSSFYFFLLYHFTILSTNKSRFIPNESEFWRGLLGGHIGALELKMSANRPPTMGKTRLNNSNNHMSWYNDELLWMADEVGRRLLPAFDTQTGIPHPRINLRYGTASGDNLSDVRFFWWNGRSCDTRFALSRCRLARHVLARWFSSLRLSADWRAIPYMRRRQRKRWHTFGSRGTGSPISWVLSSIFTTATGCGRVRRYFCCKYHNRRGYWRGRGRRLF